jgi:hypothetical protein
MQLASAARQRESAVMSNWRKRGGIGPMRWHLLAGLMVCGASVGAPWLAAVRAARVEARSSELTTCLAESVADAARHGGPDPDHVLARACALATSRSVFVADLEAQPAAEADSMLFANKHYLFRIATVAPDPARRHAADAQPAHEVLAWPIDAASAGHAMFFAAEDTPRAYTRNLANGHHGLGDRMPLPGHGRRRAATEFDRTYAYRSVGDDRWICY